MNPEFRPLPDDPGLEVVDPIETRRVAMVTDDPVTPTPTSAEEFPAPIDAACRIRTDGFAISAGIRVDVRRPDFTHRDTIISSGTRTFPAAEHVVELHLPVKAYLLVDGRLTVESRTNSVRFDFGAPTDVRVGARSFHSSPAETVTVPDDPEAVMRAVSTFSSALKTTSPERSWATLRGHPPRVERGDSLRVPDGLEPPETGVTIRVPPDYGSIYAVTPLSYYLGAAVRPGGTAAVTADSDVDLRLGDDPTEVADAARRLLERAFVLDCVTRTEGLYPDDFHEREVLERHVDLDFAALYDASLDQRLAAYLSVPDEAVDAVRPTWHRVTYVRPDPQAVELLPYVVDALSHVVVKDPSETTWSATESQIRTESLLGAFKRDPGSVDDGDPDSTGASTRLKSDAEPSERRTPDDAAFVPLPDEDALVGAWAGDETPLNGAKLLPAAFERDATLSTDGVADIAVVCNDTEMREEWDAVTEIYESRDDVRVNVNCEFDVSRDRLRDVLGRETDLLHFVGHIDGRGLKCDDGVLDAETLDDVGATTVLLNGCRSHDQGVALVEAGANAAVVSLADLWNAGAVEVGETFARLLRFGFDVGSAMTVVREYTSLGRDYVVVGDPGVMVAQSRSGVVTVVHVLDGLDSDGESPDDEVTVEMCAYPTRQLGMGGTSRPNVPEATAQHLSVGRCGRTTTTAASFREAVADDPVPMVVDGELMWSDEWFADG